MRTICRNLLAPLPHVRGAYNFGVSRISEDLLLTESDVELSSTAMWSPAPSRTFHNILELPQAVLRKKKSHTSQSIGHVEVYPASRPAKGMSTEQPRPATRAGKDHRCTSVEENPAICSETLVYGVASPLGSKPVKSGSRSITAVEQIMYIKMSEKTANILLLQFCVASEGPYPTCVPAKTWRQFTSFGKPTSLVGSSTFILWMGRILSTIADVRILIRLWEVAVCAEMVMDKLHVRMMFYMVCQIVDGDRQLQQRRRRQPVTTT